MKKLFDKKAIALRFMNKRLIIEPIAAPDCAVNLLIVTSFSGSKLI